MSQLNCMSQPNCMSQKFTCKWTYVVKPVMFKDQLYFQFYLIVLTSILIPVPYGFDFHWLVVKLETEKCESSYFVLFLVLAFLGPFASPCELQNQPVSFYKEVS